MMLFNPPGEGPMPMMMRPKVEIFKLNEIGTMPNWQCDLEGDHHGRGHSPAEALLNAALAWLDSEQEGPAMEKRAPR
jgi:hypothetical protein